MQEVSVERVGIALAKVDLDRAQQEFTEAERSLQEAKGAYQETILSYLGASPKDELAPYAISILEYADSKRLEPQWFYNNLSRATFLAVKRNMPFNQQSEVWRERARNLDNLTTAEENHSFAIDTIATELLGSKITYPLVYQVLEKAENLAIKEWESSTEPDKPRVDAVYRWLRENLSLLYDLRKEESWAHY